MNTNHKIIIGDSQHMDEIKDESINLIVSSPPYFAWKNYSSLENDLENAETYEDYVGMLQNVLQECYRVLAPDGRMCIIIDDKHTNLKTEGINKNRATHARIILMCEEMELIYKDIIIWAKARAGHASGGANYMLGSFPYPPNIPLVNWFEYILVFRKTGKRKVSKYIKEESKLGWEEFKWASQSIWYITGKHHDSHPAVFPEKIPFRLIKLFSFVDDIVLDPFLGIGTTMKVARQLGRNSIGYEINEKFLPILKEEIGFNQNTLTKDQDIFEITKKNK